MRVILHLVAKDVRRLAWPVAGWLTLLLAATLLVRCSSLPTDVALGGDVTAWVNGLRVASDLLGFVASIVTAVLTAQLVQEDTPLGSDPMWRTRPIAPARLLAAKVVAAILLLVALPLALLGPIWLASGFSVPELAGAAWEFGFGQLVVVAVAGGVAAITADLGKFLFAMIGLGLFTVGVSAYRLGDWQIGEPDPDVIQTRAALVFMIGLATAALAGAVQYFRRNRASWGVLVLGAVAMLAIRLAWPWDTLAAFPGLSGRWERGSRSPGETIAVEKLGPPPGLGQTFDTQVRIGALAAREEFVTPWSGTASLSGANGAKAEVFWLPSERWGEQAMARLLGLEPDGPAVSWRVKTMPRQSGVVFDVGPQAAITGELRLARMRARVVAELPWRPGAEAKTGAATLRIVSLVAPADSMRRVLTIEERDVWLNRLSGAGVRSQMRETDGARRDCFALVNRRLGIFLPLRIGERGTLKQNSLLLSERILECEAPTRLENGQKAEVPDWQRDAVLVKVRFEVIDRWLTPLTADRVPVAAEGK